MLEVLADGSEVGVEIETATRGGSVVDGDGAAAIEGVLEIGTTLTGGDSGSDGGGVTTDEDAGTSGGGLAAD